MDKKKLLNNVTTVIVFLNLALVVLKLVREVSRD